MYVRQMQLWWCLIAACLAQGPSAASAEEPLPKEQLGKVLSNLDKFQQVMTEDQVNFISQCGDHDQSVDSRISCGNTVDCLVKMFTGGSEARALQTSVQNIGGDEYYEQAAAEQGLTLKEIRDHFKWNDQDYEPILGADEVVEKVSGEKVDFNSSEFIRESLRASLFQFGNELLDTEDEALPRLFVPFIQWNLLKATPKVEWHGPTMKVKERFPELETYSDTEVFSNFNKEYPPEKEWDFLDEFMMAQVRGTVAYTDDATHFATRLQKDANIIGDLSVGRRTISSAFGRIVDPEATFSEKIALRSAFKGMCLKFVKMVKEFGSSNASLPDEERWEALDYQCPYFVAEKREFWKQGKAPKYQNHIFLMVKRKTAEGHLRFNLLQGYIEGTERGYDLSDWLCSRNRFASVNGFGSATAISFLDDLHTFINNGLHFDEVPPWNETERRPQGVFDGANHAEMFLVTEVDFDNKTYTPQFSWKEIKSDILRKDTLIQKMVNEVEKADKEDRFNVQACGNMEKIHGGTLMPGETLQARFGTLPGFSNTEDPSAVMGGKTAYEVLTTDMRGRGFQAVIEETPPEVGMAKPDDAATLNKEALVEVQIDRTADIVQPNKEGQVDQGESEIHRTGISPSAQIDRPIRRTTFVRREFDEAD